ncbi:MAG: hypothetical protein H7099_01110 [Gemmatimonadaceae bacterium]|nr:hypothetical protein [Gemmatimonadaceae bacterium]
MPAFRCVVLLLAVCGCAAGGGPRTVSRASANPEAGGANAALRDCPPIAAASMTGIEVTPADRDVAMRRPNSAPAPDRQQLSSLLEHFDTSLLAFWMTGVRSADRVVSVASRGRGDTRPRTLCAYERGALLRALSMGGTLEREAPLAPMALHALAHGMTPVTSGRISALIAPGLPGSVAAAVSDTLAQLEALLGVHEDTPLLAFLFANQQQFAAQFPIGWIDGVFSDWTLSEPGIGATIFAASRANGIASHELVHVALKSVYAKVDVRGSSIPYVAEEALARTIGGSRGRSYRELIGPITVVEARRLIAAQMQDAALASVRFDARRPYEPAVDALGAVYRVALSVCTAFPADLLDARAVTTLSAAVNRLSIHLRVTPDAAVDSMAVRLAAPNSVFLPGFRRSETQRLPCVAYAIPLERAHPP